MTRLAFALLALVGCADQNPDDRLEELDAQVTVDCGYVSECTTSEKQAAMVACINDNLTAGVVAKASIELGIDPVADVYTIDGELTVVEGYWEDDTPFFTEYRCQTFENGTSTSCIQPRPTNCRVVREWNR